MSITECSNQIQKFNELDRQIISIITFLFENKNLKMKRLILDDNIYLRYENGNAAKINHEELLSFLQKDLTTDDALKILTKILR